MDTRKALLVAIVAASAWVAPAWAQSSAAKLSQVSGNVLVSGEAGLTAAAEGQEVANGTRIITTARSGVVVTFDNGCRVEMAENQRLDVDSRKPCAALLPVALAVAEPAIAIPLANFVAPGLLGGGAVLGGGGGGTGTTPVSPN